MRTQQATSEDLTLPCSPSPTGRYRLEVEAGDSPPLEQLRLVAELRQPELVFEWPRTGPVELLVGGGRARAARFDLDAEAGPVRRGADSLAWTLLSDASLPAIERGMLSDNPEFDATPLLAFLQRPGAAVDPAGYRFTAELALPSSETGLHRIDLGPETLLRLLPNRSDLRFQNEGGQWPYLLERGSRWKVPLSVEVEPEGQATRYRLDWTKSASEAGERASALEMDRLRLTIAAPWFDRPYRIEQTGRDATLAASGRLQPVDVRTAVAAPGTTQRRITLDLSAMRFQPLDLVIDNGDDAPLEIVEAEASGQGWEALLVAPAGSYSVLIGAADPASHRAPRYELERAAALVRNLRGTPTTLESAERNPGARGTPVDWQKILLWLAIGTAVLGLGWVVLRSTT